MNNLQPLELRQAKKRMGQLAIRYRRDHPLPEPPRAAGSFPIACNIDGRPAIKTLAWFPSVGCWWSASGGCTFCDFGQMSYAGTLDEVVSAWVAHLDELDPGTRHLHIAPGGSFFSNREVDDTTRRAVIEATSRFPFLQSLGFETRPDELTEAKLRLAIDAMPSTVSDVYVGFGLEAVDDFVRDVIVYKGYGLDAVASAKAVIDAVNSDSSGVRIHFETYVMIKPMFLTEGEAIDEAVRTVTWSYEAGAETVVLFLNTIKEATVQALASTADLPWPLKFEPPYYRSAVEVLRRLSPELRRRTVVLGLQSGLLATGLPRGCALCTPVVVGALMAHNFVRDPMLLEHVANAHCPCRAAWRNEVERLAPDRLPERVGRGIGALEAVLDAKGTPGRLSAVPLTTHQVRGS